MKARTSWTLQHCQQRRRCSWWAIVTTRCSLRLQLNFAKLGSGHGMGTYVTLIAVAGEFLLVVIPFFTCICSRCASVVLWPLYCISSVSQLVQTDIGQCSFCSLGRFGPILYWVFELIMGALRENPPAAGVALLPQPLYREPPWLLLM